MVEVLQVMGHRPLLWGVCCLRYGSRGYSFVQEGEVAKSRDIVLELNHQKNFKGCFQACAMGCATNSFAGSFSVEIRGCQIVFQYWMPPLS